MQIYGNGSGLDLIFGGIHPQGFCAGLDQKAWFWTSTRIDNPIHIRIVNKTTGKITPRALGTAYWCSLRCVKDN